MTPLIDNAWILLDEEYSKYSEKNANLKFDKNAKDKFRALFEQKYEHIMKTYMDKSVENLDRHKVAALIIISLLELSPISLDNLDEQYLFIANELIALKTGLAYMTKKLNEKLSEKNINKSMEKFIFPEAQSCNTSYMDIMCRNLYYARNDYKLNPLDLAERLFLVEYISLLKSGINPDALKDY